MNNPLFEAALGVAEPWHVEGVRFDAAKKTLTIVIDLLPTAVSLIPMRSACVPAHPDKPVFQCAFHCPMMAKITGRDPVKGKTYVRENR